MASRSETGYQKSAYRVAARHTWKRTPALSHLPEHWWRTSPVERTRRLGLRLELDLRDNVQRTLYYTGTYEPGVIRLLRTELRGGDVFVDGGAHIGVHALTAARCLRARGGGRVFAFEPARDSAAKLRAAAARNSLDVHVVEAALGNSGGTIELSADRDYEEADAGVRSGYANGRPVQQAAAVAFDAWADEVALDRLDVVKLDVEGAELEALEGMRESLHRLRPRVLVVELKDVPLRRAGTSAEDVRRLLASYGYAPTGDVLFSANEVFRPRG